MKRKKIKKRYIVLIAVVMVIVASIVFFVQFTALGYRMTVPVRSFSELAPNVYISENYKDDLTEAGKIVDEARQRVGEFWGAVESNPMIIISDDAATIRKLGGDHDTMSFAVFNVYSYIVLSSDYLNVDVAAHELTHAEVHRRIFFGKLGYQSLIPTWFDEGVALQNDYRDAYNEEAWKAATDNGRNVVELGEINTAAKFYVGGLEERRYRYIVSKHELNDWIDRNGISALAGLLDKVNRGEDFDTLYFAK